MTAKLKAVPNEPEPTIDITALLRADIIERDWKSVHINGGKNPVLDMDWKHGRVWRG